MCDDKMSLLEFCPSHYKRDEGIWWCRLWATANRLEKRTPSDVRSFEEMQSMRKNTLNSPTDNKVLLKGHFGQGQFFYESANWEENQTGH